MTYSGLRVALTLLITAVGQQHDSLSLIQLQASSKVNDVNSYRGDEKVCVSLAAYEQADWIDALIENALKFTHESTHIMIHLNALGNYTDDRISKWNNIDRIQINPERVPVKIFHGSILYAHLLNFKHMPESCDYVIMQASNMMWVRTGMEHAVRDQKFGGIWNQSRCGEGMCSKRMQHPYFRDYIVGKTGRFGWGQHEGSFYPMNVVRSFLHHMDQSLRELRLSVQEGVVDAHDDAEEWWLQSFMVNRYDWKREYGPTLNLFVIGNHGHVSMEQVVKVSQGLRPPPPAGRDEIWNRKWGFYSAKRVVRSLKDPITRFIMNLDATPLEPGNHEPDDTESALYGLS